MRRNHGNLGAFEVFDKASVLLQSQAIYAITLHILRIPRSIMKLFFQIYVESSYSALLVAWTLFLMAKAVFATPGEGQNVNETTDSASRLSDPYHNGVHGVWVPVGRRREINMI
ncbi:hypothetical protein DFP73DRAFT_601754 [Morchella snyderi]|nr:hypothetical protein DFP73DRAFT_601754 [Morchella snyderi]